MSPIKPPFDRLMPTLRRATSRMTRGHAVALSVVAAAAFGLAGLRAVDLPGPRPISDSDRLRIEVVHPVEPEIVPGSVMEVGELVDGFQGLPPPLPPLTDAGWSYDDGWGDHAETWASSASGTRRVAEVRTWDSRAMPEPGPERASPVRAVQRWFGFDAPRRDFQAERAARRARMEAMERRMRDQRDARQREWAGRREEWLDRREYKPDRGREYEPDRERWREDDRHRDDRAPTNDARDEEIAERDAFTGPQ